MNNSMSYYIRLSVQTLVGIGAVLSFIKVLKICFNLLMGSKFDVAQLILFIFLYGFSLWVFYLLETKN